MLNNAKFSSVIWLLFPEICLQNFPCSQIIRHICPVFSTLPCKHWGKNLKMLRGLIIQYCGVYSGEIHWLKININIYWLYSDVAGIWRSLASYSSKCHLLLQLYALPFRWSTHVSYILYSGHYQKHLHLLMLNT